MIDYINILDRYIKDCYDVVEICIKGLENIAEEVLNLEVLKLNEDNASVLFSIDSEIEEHYSNVRIIKKIKEDEQNKIIELQVIRGNVRNGNNYN